MRTHKAFIGLASIAGLLLGAQLALAEDVTPAPRPGREFCKENPGKCEAARAKRAAFCQENPQKCQELKQKRAERQAFCKENPAKCEEQRAQRKAHRAEMKEKCAADPAKCEEMKQQMRERFHERHGSGPAQ